MPPGLWLSLRLANDLLRVRVKSESVAYTAYTWRHIAGSNAVCFERGESVGRRSTEVADAELYPATLDSEGEAS